MLLITNNFGKPDFSHKFTLTDLSQANQKWKVILQEKTLSVSYFWPPKNPNFHITFSYFLYY